MIKLKKISKTYINDENIVNALANINLSFPDKGLVFIIGKSGSGKSTLLNILGGLDSPSSGRIVIDNKSFSNFKGKFGDKYREKYVGFIFQSCNLIESLDVEENIKVAAYLKGNKLNNDHIEKILEKVSLGSSSNLNDSYSKRKISTLSGGEKQKVAIARALVKDPKLILADEPTGSLDRENAFEIYSLLKKLSENKLIIIVSHDQEYASYFANQIITIEDGHIKSNFKNESLKKSLGKSNSGSDEVFIKPTNITKFKEIFPLAFFSRKKNIFLNIFVAFLSFISLTIFGFSLLGYTYNLNNTQADLIYKSDYEMINLRNSIYSKGSNSFYKEISFSDKKINSIENMIGKNNFLEVYDLSSKFTFEYNISFSESSEIDSLSFNSFESVVEINGSNNFEDFKIKPDIRFLDEKACRMPTNFKEIAIDEVLAEYFITNGYLDESNTLISIKTPDDLIGKNLNGLTITGVYSSEINLDTLRNPYFFKQFNQKVSEIVRSNLASQTMLGHVYVFEGFSKTALQNNAYNCKKIIIKRPNSVSSLLKIIDKLTYKINGDGPKTSVVLGSLFYSKFASPDFLTKLNSINENIGWILGLCFGFLSIIISIFIFMPGISKNKYFNGIIRSLGARKSYILGLECLEISFTSLISLILSLFVIFIYALSINLSSGFVYYVFNWTLLGYMILISFILLIGITILPIIFQLKDESIDIIKNGRE